MIETKFLRDSLKNVEQLSEIPIFKNIAANRLASLLKLSKIRKYEAGERIIRKGDKDRWLYFLLRGSARVRDRGYPIGKIDRVGEIFGEMRLTDGRERSASVFAETETTCLAVDLDAKYRLDSREEEARVIDLLFSMIAKNLSMRLRATNDALIRVRDDQAAGFIPASYLTGKRNEPVKMNSSLN